MNILYMTQNDTIYLPNFFESVLSRGRESIKGIVILSISPFGEKISFLRKVRKTLEIFGTYFFLRTSFEIVLNKVLDILGYFFPSKKKYSIKAVAQKYNIPLLNAKDINEPDFLGRIKTMHLDLIISISANQIFRKKLLDIPKLGCLNLHGALLPKYRGLMPTFWALANGEKYAGSTIFLMDEGIDSGDIIVQKKFEISPDDTLNSLIRKSKMIGAEVVVDAIEVFRKGNVNLLPNRKENSTYYSFPTKKDVDLLRKSGRRLY